MLTLSLQDQFSLLQLLEGYLPHLTHQVAAKYTQNVAQNGQYEDPLKARIDAVKRGEKGFRLLFITI